MLSTTDRAVRLIDADAAKLRLVLALREAGLSILAGHVTARVGMIDGARLDILPLTLHEADALTAALRRAQIVRR